MPRAGLARLRAPPRPRRPPALLRPGVRGGGGGSVCGVARVAAGAGEGGGGPRGTREAAEWTERCNAREMNRAVSKRRSGSGEQTLDALLHLRDGVLLDLLPKGLPLGLFLGRHLQRLDRIEPAEPFGDGFWRRRPLFFCDTECIILCVVDRFLHGFRFLPLRLRAVFPILAPSLFVATRRAPPLLPVSSRMAQPCPCARVASRCLPDRWANPRPGRQGIAPPQAVQRAHASRRANRQDGPG